MLTGAAAAIKGELMGFGGAAAHLFVREGAEVVLTDVRARRGTAETGRGTGVWSSVVAAWACLTCGSPSPPLSTAALTPIYRH
jgi:NAD(P)-dependent dehydrogenase (short-subunit alcohol dehydrogenase family)